MQVFMFTCLYRVKLFCDEKTLLVELTNDLSHEMSLVIIANIFVYIDEIYQVLIFITNYMKRNNCKYNIYFE